MHGTTATNKEKHRKIAFCNENNVSRCVNDPFYRQCNQLNDKTLDCNIFDNLANFGHSYAARVK
jgi:hypothetical protein